MLRLLPGGSAPRIRLLAKFVEKDFEKLDKLVKLRRDYASKVSAIEADIKTERARTNADDLEEMEAEWLSRRMDAGLFSLQVFISPPYCNFLLSDCAECGCQTTDVILAWLIAEDDGANRKIKALLADRDESASMLRVTLQGSHFPLLPPSLSSPISRPASRIIERLRQSTEQLNALQEDAEGDKMTADMLSTLLQFV
jgi:beta-catenin-like protein 1